MVKKIAQKSSRSVGKRKNTLKDSRITKKSNFQYEKRHYFWAGLRIAVGLIFLWAFFDKLLGLGFATCMNSETNSVELFCDNAWVNGGSPTFGFLSFATKGPFAGFFQGLAGSVLVEWLFMFGLLFIGLTLTLGILVRIGSLTGALMLFLMWLATLFPKNNPFIDDHIIYIILMLGFAFVHTCKYFGLGAWWQSKEIVRRNRFLE
jgi:thiosulfate dehydrogenase (quinone) large subunit